MAASKFQLFDLSGKTRERFLVRERDLELSDSKAGQKHHIIIVDRSGSMYYDIGALKESLKKVLTLHEYHDDSMLVSLLSYSSFGDLTTHFVKKRVSAVDQSEIDRLVATNLTCISQSIEAIQAIVDPDQITGVTLHSDGYANDPSSFAEKRAIFDACEGLKGSNIFVNTISHSDYSDFSLLSGVANAMSGRCVKAMDIKTLYDSIVQTFETLNSDALGTISVPMDGDDFLAYVCDADKKVIGASDDLTVTGVDLNSAGVVYGFRAVDKGEYENSPLSEHQSSGSVFAFSRAKLAQGNVNAAKYALVSTGNATLQEKHWRAMTATDLALMAIDLEDVLFGNLDQKCLYTETPIEIDDSLTVLDVLHMMEKHKNAISLNLSAFLPGYKRRGIKRISGKRDENGSLIEPWLDTECLGDKSLGSISSLDISTTSANVSINVTQKCRLVKRGTSEPISRVAGVDVAALTSFKSYTIVADGELTVDDIPVYISNKKAFDAFKKLKLLSSASHTFAHNQLYRIRLKGLPVTRLSVKAGDLYEAIGNYFKGKVILSFIDAVLKEDSDEFTSEQIDDLKKHYLSKSLFLNFPTTNEYSNLDEAIKTGQIDVRTAFKVKFGIDGILGADSFKSANAFLSRMYSADCLSGKEKPNCTMVLGDSNVQWETKQLSKRSKTSAADLMQKCIFDTLLFSEDEDDDAEDILGLLRSAGDVDLRNILSKNTLQATDKSDVVSVLTSAKKAVSRYMDEIYTRAIFPASFYIGVTGMVPDDWENVQAMSADDLKQMWPEAKIGKKEADGVFFKVGEVVFGVCTEKRYVSIDR